MRSESVVGWMAWLAVDNRYVLRIAVLQTELS